MAKQKKRPNIDHVVELAEAYDARYLNQEDEFQEQFDEVDSNDLLLEIANEFMESLYGENWNKI